MSTFEKLHVQGFRRLHDVDLKLEPLNVLIGANGSGKTTMLDVFTLLSASASGNLKETVRDLGGVDSQPTADAHPDQDGAVGVHGLGKGAADQLFGLLPVVDDRHCLRDQLDDRDRPVFLGHPPRSPEYVATDQDRY